jgi:Mn2+/Fe2+ NRAMP family transporter
MFGHKLTAVLAVVAVAASSVSGTPLVEEEKRDLGDVVNSITSGAGSVVGDVTSIAAGAYQTVVCACIHCVHMVLSRWQFFVFFLQLLVDLHLP